MSEAFQPTLEYFFDTVKPGVPHGTMIAEISFLPSSLGARDGGDGDQPGDVGAGVGDERLGAVDDPLGAVVGEPRVVVVVPPASDPAPGSVSPKAPSTWPGTAAAATRALLLGAEPVDRHRAERDRRLQRDGHRRVDPGQLLESDAEREVVAAHAAVLLGERQAEQPHLAHLRGRSRTGTRPARRARRSSAPPPRGRTPRRSCAATRARR